MINVNTHTSWLAAGGQAASRLAFGMPFQLAEGGRRENTPGLEWTEWSDLLESRARSAGIAPGSAPS